MNVEVKANSIAVNIAGAPAATATDTKAAYIAVTWAVALAKK